MPFSTVATSAATIQIFITLFLLLMQTLFMLNQNGAIALFHSTSDSYVRVNTKHLNKLFNKFSMIRIPVKRDSHYLATTIDYVTDYNRRSSTQQKNFGSAVNVTEDFGRSNHLANSSDHTEHNQANVTSPLKPSNVSMSPYRMLENSISTVVPVLKSTVSQSKPIQVTMGISPEQMCNCMCNTGSDTEIHNVPLKKLRVHLTETDTSTAPNKSTEDNKKIVDVLDSLIDEDENDYDDIDELEEIQKPNKYIPMEIIELAHRRPHRKSTTSTTSTTTISPHLVPVKQPTSSAPLYSFSFAKPMTTLKSIATRAVHYGLPLLVTVALGNALTQIELIDRSFEEDSKPVNWTFPLPNYGSLFGFPIESHGYYTPFYDSLVQTPVGHSSPTLDTAAQYRTRDRKTIRKKIRLSSKISRKISNDWTDTINTIKRWFKRSP